MKEPITQSQCAAKRMTVRRAAGRLNPEQRSTGSMQRAGNKAGWQLRPWAQRCIVGVGLFSSILTIFAFVQQRSKPRPTSVTTINSAPAQSDNPKPLAQSPTLPNSTHGERNRDNSSNIYQHSEGANSPNTAIINEEPLRWYDFSGAKHERNGNQSKAEARAEIERFQEMARLEHRQDSNTLADLPHGKNDFAGISNGSRRTDAGGGCENKESWVAIH